MKKKIIISIVVLLLLGAICLLPNSKCNKTENNVDNRDVANAVSLQEKRDEATICLEVITSLYEDDDYIYNVPSSCYGDITYVSFADGSRMSIKEALFKNKVTIDELISLGAKIYKEGKMSIQPVDEWTIKHIDRDLTCANVITTLYEDNNYVYTVSNPCYIYENYVVYSDGSKYNLQDALNFGKVTIDELINKGLKINKEGKMSTQPVDDIGIQPVDDIGIQPVTKYLETRNSGKSCANVLTTLYEDNNYRYSVSSPCYLNDTYVVYSNGTSYNIKTALRQGKVTINELIKMGAIIYKESKVSVQPVTWKIVKENNGNMCMQAIATLYESNDYVYSVANACVLNDTYVVYSTGEKINIKKALDSGKVDIDELVKELNKKGIKVYKSTIYRANK